MTSDKRSATYQLSRCKGCGAVGLVERGEYQLCGRCLPNAYAIHEAERIVKRLQEKANGC